MTTQLRWVEPTIPIDSISRLQSAAYLIPGTSKITLYFKDGGQRELGPIWKGPEIVERLNVLMMTGSGAKTLPKRRKLVFFWGYIRKYERMGIGAIGCMGFLATLIFSSLRDKHAVELEKRSQAERLGKHMADSMARVGQQKERSEDSLELAIALDSGENLSMGRLLTIMNDSKTRKWTDSHHLSSQLYVKKAMDSAERSLSRNEDIDITILGILSNPAGILPADTLRLERLLQKNGQQVNLRDAKELERLTLESASCKHPNLAKFRNLIRSHDYWEPPILGAIICGQVRIGMTAKQAVAAWGRPENINRTTTSYGVHEQWVYSGSYLYFEDGVLTSIQN